MKLYSGDRPAGLFVDHLPKNAAQIQGFSWDKMIEADEDGDSDNVIEVIPTEDLMP